LEGRSHGLIELLSQNLSVETENTYGKSESGETVSRPDSNQGPPEYNSRELLLHKRARSGAV
jgi:hypothetical protein